MLTRNQNGGNRGEKEVRSVWEESNICWNSLPAVGRAEGVLILWRGDRFICKKVVVGRTSISCLFEDRHGGKESWVFTGVYCRATKEEKKTLWEELKECSKCWGHR